MAHFVSRTAILLAAIAAPTAVLAQDSEQRIQVIGAIQDPEQRIQVIGAIQDPEQRIQVIGAIQDPEQRIQVIGAANERGETAPAEDPADKALPEIPVVYEDDEAAPAEAQPSGDPDR